MIPRDFIDELLARTDIVSLIDGQVPLRKRGHNYQACCPFHQEKTPSFTVSPNKQFYHCFGCGANGNAISFLMEHGKLDFISAVEALAKDANMEVPQDDNAPRQKYRKDLYDFLTQAAAFYALQLRQHPEKEAAINYLKNRQLTGAIAKRYQMGLAPSGWQNIIDHIGKQHEKELLLAGLAIRNEKGRVYDRFRERIMFPIRDRRGRVIAFGGRVLGDEQPKYMNSPETPVFHKGRELYGLYEAIQANKTIDRFLIVEGYMDVIALAQHGFSTAVATMGTAATTEHLQLLSRHSQQLIFCFDGDSAGRKAAERALLLCLAQLQDGQDIRFLFVPQGQDPDSLVREEGAQAFEHRIANAMPLNQFLQQHLTATIDLSTAAGKSALAKSASELIATMPQSHFREMLWQQFGRLVGLSAERLQQLTDADTAPQSQPLPPSKRSPMRLVISLLLQQPSLLDQLDAGHDLQAVTLPGGELLSQLVQRIKANPEITAGGLLEHWRTDPATYQQLAKLAIQPLTIPESGRLAELSGACERLQHQQLEKQLEQLMAKANQTGLSTAEKQQLQALIATARS